MTQLRLAAVGCGGLCRARMLPAVLARQDVIVTALVDPNATSVEEARKVGAKEASMFASVEDALRADRVMDGYRRNIAYLAAKGMRL